MTKAITSKELRTKFPWVKEQIERGTNFVVYYRSKPILELRPYEQELSNKSGKPGWEEWKAYKEEILEELQKEGADLKPLSSAERKRRRRKMAQKKEKFFRWDDIVTHTYDREPYSAVELIREDRGYDIKKERKEDLAKKRSEKTKRSKK